MALYTPGAFAPIISGSVGATVFSHNAGGAYMKNKSIPLNPNSPYQISARNLLTLFAQKWRSLTEAQQAAWNAAAPSFPVTNRIGETITLSGFNFYVRQNININLAGGSSISVPPSPGTVVSPLTFSGTCTGGAISLIYTATPVPTGQVLFVYGTIGLSTGKNFVKSQFRLFAVLAAAAASPFSATTLYTARFGPPLSGVGQKLFFQIEPVVIASGLTGIRSEAVVYTA
jgi:hypothetical protein